MHECCGLANINAPDINKIWVLRYVVWDIQCMCILFTRFAILLRLSATWDTSIRCTLLS